MVDAIGLLLRFIRDCWAHRLFFAKAWAITVTLGLLLALGSTKEYTSATRILPYSSGKGASGGIGALAGIAGINISPTMPGQVISTEVYPEVASSFTFLTDLARVPIRFREGRWTYERFFASVYQPSTLEIIHRYTLGLPSAFAIGGEATRDPLATIESAEDTVPVYSTSFISLVHGLRDRVRTTMDKKTNILTISATMPDPVAAADLARLAGQKLTVAIVAYESKRASEQATFLAGQQAAAERRYLLAQSRLADFQDRNRAMGSPKAQVEFQRLQQEVSLSFDVLKSLSSQLETARVKEKEDTPVLTVLDPSLIPTEPSRPRIARILILSMFVGAFVGGFYVLWLYWRALRFV